MRHDAQKFRENVRSEQIRFALGILTPKERQAQAEAERVLGLLDQKMAQQGTPLGLEEAGC